MAPNHPLWFPSRQSPTHLDAANPPTYRSSKCGLRVGAPRGQRGLLEPVVLRLGCRGPQPERSTRWLGTGAGRIGAGNRFLHTQRLRSASASKTQTPVEFPVCFSCFFRGSSQDPDPFEAQNPSTWSVFTSQNCRWWPCAEHPRAG